MSTVESNKTALEYWELYEKFHMSFDQKAIEMFEKITIIVYLQRIITEEEYEEVRETIRLKKSIYEWGEEWKDGN